VLEGQQARADKRAAASSPLLEVQVVDAADSVAYDAHDADDALQLGLVTLEELIEVPLWSEAAQNVRRKFAELNAEELRRAIVHQLIDSLVSDLLTATSARLGRAAPANVDAVRGSPVFVAPSSGVAERKAELERFLYAKVYRHPAVLATRTRAQHCLRAMFESFLAEPGLLPESFAVRSASAGWPRTIADYLAGMTDRFALREHRRLCEE
jgi:dGTPase